MLNYNEYVTLEDVTSDRQALAEAHRRLNARRPIEWMLGSSMFAVAFGVTTWFLQPSATLGLYVIITVVCFVTGGVTVLLNKKEQRAWRKAKEDELEIIENKIRAGEKVPRPNPSCQGTRRDEVAPHP
jgi:Flp pilus assembly protein TadB